MELEQIIHEHHEKWRRDGLRNIKPDSLTYGEFPEGWDVVSGLQRHINSLPHKRIIDLGCGYGRLCKAFDPAKYLGLDINESAIAAAHTANPNYKFKAISYVDQYPAADIYLAYTVFLHIPDEVLKEIVHKVCAVTQILVVAEILADKSLDSGNSCGFKPHAVYHRSRQDYQRLLAQENFSLWEDIHRPYRYYGEAELSLLIFKRNEPPPSLLTHFPGALAHPSLQFEGIEEDGWTRRKFSVRLSRTAKTQQFQLEATLPSHTPESKLGGTLTVTIEDQPPHIARIQTGEIRLSLQIKTQKTEPLITVEWDNPQKLPPPDGREIAMLLKSIGFVA